MKRDSITFEEAIEIEKKIGEKYWKSHEEEFFRLPIFHDGEYHIFVGEHVGIKIENGDYVLGDILFHYIRKGD